MEILGTVAKAIQGLFAETVQTAAEKSQVVQRQRKFSAMSLLQTFTMGFLKKASASDEELAQVAALVGVPVTTQAVEQRHTPQMATFL